MTDTETPSASSTSTPSDSIHDGDAKGLTPDIHEVTPTPDVQEPKEPSNTQDVRTSSVVQASDPSPNFEDLKPSSSIPEFKPSGRLYVAFLTLAVITLMVALDGTSLSVALPIIAQKLRGTAIEAFWSGTSFLLCSTVFAPSFASFSHIFGRKPVVLFALVLFTIGAIVASVSKGFGPLLVGRSLQGIGGGGLIALTEIIVTDMVPLRLRGKWFGIISAMWSLGSVTGPVVGGVFAEKTTWRWIFYINFPFAGVAFVFIPLFLRLNFVPQKITDQLKRVDWIGTVLFVGSTTSFLIPITWGGVMYAWSSWRTLVPLIVGILGLIAFVLYEIYLAKEQLIRLDIFQNRTSSVSYFQTVLHGMILWCMLYYLPLYYEAVKNETPILSGVSVFPETFTVAPSAVVVGAVITKIGKYRWAIWSGWFITTLGTGLLYLLDVNTATVSWIFLNLVSGLGMGILFPSMGFSVQAASTPKNVAFAVAMWSFFRAFGQALGVAIGGTIFQNQMKLKLMKYPLLAPMAAEYSKDASSLVQIIKAMEQGTTRAELIQGYADSLKVVWAVLCGLAGVGLLTCFFIQEYDLNRAIETEQGFVEEKKTIDEEK